MRILYGVQGTGNGHLSRARLMAEAFSRFDVEVDYLFSGRAPQRYFDMQVFGNPEYRAGLSFVIRDGRLDRWHTLAAGRPARFLGDVARLRTDRYDLVLSDFEPVTAWAARRRGTPLIAFGHQYALLGDGCVPMPSGDRLSRAFLRHYAPSRRRVGLHWHHFDGPILPPMVPRDLCRHPVEQDYTLVYLPFHERETIRDLLQPIDAGTFVVYTPVVHSIAAEGNIEWRPLSAGDFRAHLCGAARIVCSSGFELISEALSLGLPVLTVPVGGQFEQRANALALEQLGLARVVERLSFRTLLDFIYRARATGPLRYPDVAAAVAAWCVDGGETPIDNLVESLWRDVQQPPTALGQRRVA